MSNFKNINLNRFLYNALSELGFEKQTAIQEQTFSKILSGKDIVGIAQTGTGKTLAYCLPLLQEMSYSNQNNPRILILVPTRELVTQVEETLKELTKYITCKIIGVYGGANINTQKLRLKDGADIIVATPGRFYDLVLCKALQVKGLKKIVIDEVDIMLDLGFRFQLTNIFELLPDKKQNIMFSATMTDDVEELINSFFYKLEKIQIALSGTPLENIEQQCYLVKNFFTKINLLSSLISDKQEFKKVLVFVSSKRNADLIYEKLKEDAVSELGIIHSNKSQNYRIRTIKQFEEGVNRILITTDVMSRGLDLDKISHVINFDTPIFPENYMHRIGRTGRAKEIGNAILFYTEKEKAAKEAIEKLMSLSIVQEDFPVEVALSNELAPEEKPRISQGYNPGSKLKISENAYHEKKEKNSKSNQGGSYRKKLAQKYKKPKTKGDKNFNRRHKK